MDRLSHDIVLCHVRAALAEDVGSGDVTTSAAVPESARARAEMNARERIVLAGIAFAETAFRELAPEIKLRAHFADGDVVAPGRSILSLEGRAAAILTAERVALNFVQRLSGVATATALFVEAVRGTGAQILDTRKTTPGWRQLEKYAVACGGGRNHRFGLFDLVLVKDNHLAAARDALPNPIAAAIRGARAKFPALKVEVECDTNKQVQQAVDARADIILLDNMSPEQLRAAVSLIAGRAKTEASGGVTLETVRAIAESGVDYISVGAITHSARAVDVGLDFV